LLALLASPVVAAPPKPTVPLKPDSSAPWKVEDAHGPSSTVVFTTDEATWLALDVSPDGQTIVLSLLGDLYTLPIAGGTARRLTSGAAYDAQPRYSPDGKWIAFASDRGGTENLWICDSEGQHPRQVSSEPDAFVNSPTWAPDGEWLIGRKRLTDLSSLGTVELWMWHVKGGKGVQVTKRDEQPDAADAAFSPDGRFLYYAARDARYKYDRNVNEGIWQIKRLDRMTGQTQPVLQEFGGATAPVVSRDGRSLAYVRRVRARTRLELLDLASGRTRVLVDGITRDNQEGFAFHGTFPGYAFSPDGHEIVATADGKIWRYDVGTGQRQAVPFSAKVEQRVTEAIRFPRRIEGDSVRARVIRWPVESPDGKKLVFVALGHLYVQDRVAGAKPRRLTDSADLEFAPAFSPDGARLAYVTWNDAEGGHVWTLDLAGGTPQRVTTVAAQYANPAFSPDGRQLVFVRGTGAALRGHDLADELAFEIEVAPAAGGESSFVTGVANRGSNRRMPRPVFSPSGQRIFFVDDEPGEKPTEPGKTAFASCKLDGTDRRVHLRFAFAEEVSLAPDGRHVAFRELHDLYVTPLPRNPTPVEVGVDKGALPVGKLTEDGGDWIGWADGGRTLTWVAGPVYSRLALDKALPIPPAPEPAPPKGAKPKAETAKLPVPEALEIVLEAPRAHGEGLVAYRGARLVTLKGDEVIEDGTLLVDGERIVAIGPSASVSVPAAARTVDVKGRTIIPGLIDEHAHLHYSALDVFAQRPWKYAANLAYGITTTHDPSASTQEVFGQGEMVAAGLMDGPRIFSTGYILYGADGAGKAPISSLDDARHHVRRLKAQGAISVKSYMQPRREQRQWILQAAREEGLLVVPEGGGDLEADLTMVLDGHTTIEHSLPFAPLRKDVLGLLAGSQTAYTPTLLVAYSGLSGDRWFHQHYDLWKDERLQRFVPQSVVDTLGRIRKVMATDPADWHHLDVAASAKAAADLGVRINLGGHGQMQGLGPHWELWAFVQAGMPPLQALKVGSLWPAQTLGLDRDLGSLEAGKLADFVVLEKNPLEKIENSETVELVVKGGRAYRPADLALRQR
jgi:Tol biopolymer transport system component/imidazolonepropionase-like amidohydrolase